MLGMHESCNQHCQLFLLAKLSHGYKLMTQTCSHAARLITTCHDDSPSKTCHQVSAMGCNEIFVRHLRSNSDTATRHELAWSWQDSPDSWICNSNRSQMDLFDLSPHTSVDPVSLLLRVYFPRPKLSFHLKLSVGPVSSLSLAWQPNACHVS